jgi:hypothetical protein
MQRNRSLRQPSVLENRSNPALNLAPFGRWTLRDKAAQRRLALRWAKAHSQHLSVLIDPEHNEITCKYFIFWCIIIGR